MVARPLVGIGAVLTAVLMACSGCTVAPGTDPSAAPSTRPAPVGPLLFEWYPDDGPKTLYLSDASGTDPRRITEDVAPGTAHVHASWSPDGSRITFEALDEEKPSSSAWIADADGSGAKEAVSCTSADCVEIAFPAFSPDGRRLVVVQFDDAPGKDWGPSHLVSVDLATGRRTDIARTADGATAYYNPRWSPDGRSIAVQVETYPDATESSITGSAVDVVSVATGESRTVAKPSMFAGHPDFRPTDGLIVFDTYDLAAFGDTPHDSNLYTVRPDGSGLRQLTRSSNAGGTRIGLPTWTPDGRGIAATIGIVLVGTADRSMTEAHLATVTYPGGAVEDLNLVGANGRRRPTG